MFGIKKVIDFLNDLFYDWCNVYQNIKNVQKLCPIIMLVSRWNFCVFWKKNQICQSMTHHNCLNIYIHFCYWCISSVWWNYYIITIKSYFLRENVVSIKNNIIFGSFEYPTGIKELPKWIINSVGFKEYIHSTFEVFILKQWIGY